MDWVALVGWVATLGCIVAIIAICRDRAPQLDKAAREAHVRKFDENLQEIQRDFRRLGDISTPH
jgi:hypothetical protein